MKICMTTRTFPPRTGGPGSVVNKVSKALIQEGFDVTVITQSISGAPNYEVKDGVVIHRADIISETEEFTPKNLMYGSYAFLKKILKNKDHDIFHAHDISVAGFSTCLAKKFIHKKPFFLKYGGDLVLEYLGLKHVKGWDPKWGLEGTLKFKSGIAGVLHKIQDWYFRNYNLMLPDAEYGRQFLIRRGVNPKKVKTNVNGVDTQQFRPISDIAKENLKNELKIDGKNILIAARLVEWKGIDILIQAMPEILKSTNANLLIAGDGPYESYLKELTNKLKLEKNVIFLGKVDHSIMQKYINACDVFSLPSYFDTTPNVLLEAMACGIPSVVSDIDGVREVIVGGSALAAKVGDSHDVAEKIVSLLTNSELAKRVSESARKKIEDTYSWDQVIKNYIDLYKNYQKYI